jgi:hypothetical protein
MKTDFVGYTVRDWKKKFYPDGHHIHSIQAVSDVKNPIEIPGDTVICDVCNIEIKQPKGDIEKKVVWDYIGGYNNGNWALCTECKDNPEKFDRSKRLMDEYKKLTGLPLREDKKQDKMMIDEVTEFVNNSILNGLKKGWYKFKDKNMTIQKYVTLSEEEKDSCPVGITELGKSEDGDSTNVLKLLEDMNLSHTLFRTYHMDKQGNITIELTEEGLRVKKLYEVSGLDFSSYIQKKMRFGLQRLFSEYIVLEKNERHIKGHMRFQ